jgi:hypothetical protein
MAASRLAANHRLATTLGGAISAAAGAAHRAIFDIALWRVARGIAQHRACGAALAYQRADARSTLRAVAAARRRGCARSAAQQPSRARIKARGRHQRLAGDDKRRNGGMTTKQRGGASNNGMAADSGTRIISGSAVPRMARHGVRCALTHKHIDNARGARAHRAR